MPFFLALIRRLPLLLSPLLLLVMVGCATNQTVNNTPPREQVLERSHAYWLALRAGNAGEAYQFLAPAYRRLVSETDYWRRASGDRNWKSVEVIDAECDDKTPDRCVAIVRMVFNRVLVSKVDMNTHRREDWVKDEDQWWLVPRR